MRYATPVAAILLLISCDRAPRAVAGEAGAMSSAAPHVASATAAAAALGDASASTAPAPPGSPPLEGKPLDGPHPSVDKACAALVAKCRAAGGKACACAPSRRSLEGAAAPYVAGTLLTVTYDAWFDDGGKAVTGMTTKSLNPALQTAEGWFASPNGIAETGGAGMGHAYRGVQTVQAFRVESVTVGTTPRVVFHVRDATQQKSQAPGSAWVASDVLDEALLCGIGTSNRPSCTAMIQASATTQPPPGLPFTELPTGDVHLKSELESSPPHRLVFP